MSYALGYGHEVWSAGNYYFWIPMVAPFFGCLFGGWLYDVFIFTGMFSLLYPGGRDGVWILCSFTNASVSPE